MGGGELANGLTIREWKLLGTRAWKATLGSGNNGWSQRGDMARVAACAFDERSRKGVDAGPLALLCTQLASQAAGHRGTWPNQHAEERTGSKGRYPGARG